MIVWLARVFEIAAIGLVAFGIWQLLRHPAQIDDNPPLIVHWPKPDMGAGRVGPTELVVRIANPSVRPRQILGMMKTCGLNACAKPKFDEPVTVPPGGTVPYSCVLDVGRPGPFEVSIHLYLEDRGVREVETTIRGVGVVSGGAINGGKLVSEQ